ncbi:MAG: electron transfer flavoprotein beta subunit/FixA family protein [Chitinophagia bacterium]|nr:electron transfer flavoprotein beta subunit/FixA family protein [Chitinophagia bacterium]
MKILVCISKTPDTTSRIAFIDNNTRFDESGVQWIINPYDEWYALVRAIELKEKDPATVLHLVSVGGADCDPILRKALALGGDEAFRINLQSNDSFAVAKQIEALCKKEQYNLIFTGKEAIDSNNGALGGMLAALYQAEYIPLATRFELTAEGCSVTREMDGGEETISCSLPAVISCQKGMAEQRIPNMRGIMGARTKPLHVIEPEQVKELTAITNYQLPAPKAGVKLVSADNVAELVRLLHEEAKVI